MKKIVIFDFDYTLGDSTVGIIASISHALDKMNFGIPGNDAIVKTIGLSLEETYEVLTGRTDSNEKADFKKYFIEKADEVVTPNTSLYDGVADMLEKIHNRGIKIAIVTTKYHYRIEQILDVNNIGHLIDGIIGGDDVANPKPDPEGIFKIKEQFEVSLEEILYLGDSIVDAKATMAAGVDFMAVLTGTTASDEFMEYPYVEIIEEATGVADMNIF